MSKRKILTDEMKKKVVEVYSSHPELDRFQKADLINAEFDTNFGESTFRKYYATHSEAYNFAINENAGEKKLKQIAKAQTNLMLEQKKNTLMKRGIHTTLRHRALDDYFLEAFKEALKGLKVDKLPKLDNKSKKGLKNPNTMVMFWGDAQIGREVDLPHNKYNLKIAIKRSNAFIEKCISRAKTENIKDIVFIDMGDAVDGNSLRDGHLFALENDLKRVSEQIVECYNLKASMIKTLRSKGFNVTFASVPSNHCRTQGNKMKNVPLDDFGLAVDKMLNTSIGGKIELKVIDKHNEWFRLDVAGKKILLAHGDKIKKGARYLPRHFRATYPTVAFDYIVTAHYHHFQHLDQWVQNGALMGTDDYATNKGYNAKAKQCALTIIGGEIQVYDFVLQ